MMDVKYIVGIGASVAVLAVLSGVFDGEVGRSNAAFKSATNKSPTGQSANNAAQVPFGAPNMMAQGPSALAQAQMMNSQSLPSFVNVAAPNQATSNVPNFLPQNIQISEAHWQGMDVTILTSELRRKLRYPQGLLGLLVDEVTLNAARSGLMAGDIIINVENVPVTTLEEFQQSSRMVRNMNTAALTALRKGEMGEGSRYSMRRVSVVLTGDPDVGFAQLESAPMIVPGDGRPHPYRGACTNCHAVGVGFELTPDPDLITLPPPVLTHATVVKGVSPHLDRGPCEACHQIIR